MAVKFQYNKTSLNEIGKQLKVRQKALPTLQNKESALRLEVRKAKNESDRLIADLEAAMERYDYLASLWNEFDPGLVAIKFQYNKTSLTNLGKQLKVRQNALPTLKNKESALRSSVQTAKAESERLADELEASLQRYDYLAALWNEFDPGLIRIADVELRTVKVAGVKTPHLDTIRYEIQPFNAFVKPAWYADGVAILKELSRLGIESEIYEMTRQILEYNRKKTTQKVNLYEKVQIPGYKEAIRKIKRYMEDEENLSKASSKIVKTRHAEEEEASL